MAKEKQEAKIILEREYTIPLRRKWLKVPQYKRANKAVKAIKQFLAKHMKVVDRDIKKVKVDKWLNNELWFRGIRKPPAKIKVKAKKFDNGIVNVFLVDIPRVLGFKIAREKKQRQAFEKEKEKAEEKKKEEEKRAEEEKKETEKGKLEEKVETEKKPEEETERKKEKAEEKKVEAEEKKEAVVEAGLEQAKMQAKQQKHEVGGKIKGPKHQRRMALEK